MKMHSNTIHYFTGCSEREELNDVVAAKIEKLIAELQGTQLNPVDCVTEIIKNGFLEFKHNKFEYISLLILTSHFAFALLF